MKLSKNILAGLILSGMVVSTYASVYCPSDVHIQCTGSDLWSCHADTQNWVLSGAMSFSGEMHSGSYVFVEAGDTSLILGKKEGYVYCMYKQGSDFIYVDQGEMRILAADTQASASWHLSDNKNEYQCGDYQSSSAITTAQCPLKYK